MWSVEDGAIVGHTKDVPLKNNTFLIWKDGKVVGWITSGGYCHHAGCSMAMGYVPTETLSNGAGKATWEIEIIGQRRSANRPPRPCR